MPTVSRLTNETEGELWLLDIAESGLAGWTMGMSWGWLGSEEERGNGETEEVDEAGSTK